MDEDDDAHKNFQNSDAQAPEAVQPRRSSNPNLMQHQIPQDIEAELAEGEDSQTIRMHAGDPPPARVPTVYHAQPTAYHALRSPSQPPQEEVETEERESIKIDRMDASRDSEYDEQ
eukprot:TRINITY_DN11034_c0_g1_i7.p1 TRINITY_DN11034_c0_g1~~TRINITY_DN11034_c0_g1_i7.p1  ORF type:complete len:116 (+),score=11.88 TRINITY_DN11034_c0_g1_i7:233-580(+)